MTPNPNPSPEAIMCGGCGETDGEKRCMGCMHDFGTPESAWVQKYRPEPILTKAMIEAGETECRLQHGAKRVWLAMHAAALTPPTPAETVTVALPGAGEVERDPFAAFYAQSGLASDLPGPSQVVTISGFLRAVASLDTVAAANDEGVAKAIEAAAKIADDYALGEY